MPYGFYGFDYTYFLFIVPALIITMYAQAKVSSTFAKYSRVGTARGVTGAEAARAVAEHGGASGVSIRKIAGKLTDNFDPRTNVISLSEVVYGRSSVASVGVAAHEAGHAVQTARGYLPNKIRTALVPVTNVGSRLSFPLIILGLILPVQYDFVVYAGIALFALVVLFQLATLPVEFNASARAVEALGETGILYPDELEGAKKVLRAAAMTYLAASFSAFMNLLRLFVPRGQQKGQGLMEDARTAALKALLRVDGDEGYSNLVLDGTLGSSSADRREKALATAIFYGVLERRITLDYMLAQFSKTPLPKLSPAVLEILRIGAYQLLYLEKIPPSAAVNECVNLAKRNKQARASGFVNAVLRNLLRAKGKLRMPDPAKDRLGSLSVTYSCPKWLIRLWESSYGEACTLGLLGSLCEKPPVFARVNNTLISEENLLERLACEGMEAKRCALLPGAVELSHMGDIGESESYRAGLLHVQDLSSQICCALLDPRPGETVADVCAAPGGKTFTAAERMENRGRVLSFDRTPARVGLIREGAARLKLSCVETGVRDASAPAGEPLRADRVLCDVPCSGLGILRRKPEVRYKLPSTIDSLPDLQYLILCKSSAIAADGGVLVYSTCTLNPGENAGVADRFLAEHGEFEPLALRLPKGIRRAVPEPDNQITLMPHVNGTDGFFVAAFQKR